MIHSKMTFRVTTLRITTKVLFSVFTILSMVLGVSRYDEFAVLRFIMLCVMLSAVMVGIVILMLRSAIMKN